MVLARENLDVPRKSLDEAQKSYDHDKKALSLGALPPLDIYRSESQVASRRVGVIQADAGTASQPNLKRQVAYTVDEETGTGTVPSTTAGTFNSTVRVHIKSKLV